MRWEGGRESDNVEDVRTSAPQAMMIGGGLGTLVIVILGLLFGADPSRLIQVVQQAQRQQAPGPGGGGGEGERQLSPEEEREGKFIRVVLADTEDVWTAIFAENGRRYEKPTLRLFSGSTDSACGMADAAVGPFYCPGDQKVYLDTEFFQLLSSRFGESGEFARAYVVAHEIGHHVQRLLGTKESRTLDALRQRGGSKTQINAASVDVELQADFLAGVWANRADKMRKILEPGDVESALNAASKIGDDALQKQAQGYVVPDSFTHGTSAQRVFWFRKGLQTGDISQGNTSDSRN